MEPSAKLVWKPSENLICAVIRTDFIIWILLLLSPLQSFDLGLKKALHLKQTREHSQTLATFCFSVCITAKLLSPYFCCISFNVKRAKDLSYCYLPEWLKVGIQCHGVQVTAWLSLFGLLLLESGISSGWGVPGGPACLHLPACRRPTDAGASILSLAVSVHRSGAAPYWTDVDVSENFTMSLGNRKLCAVRTVFVLIYSISGAGQTWAALLPLSGGKQITMVTTLLTKTCFLATFLQNALLFPWRKKAKCIIYVPLMSPNCKNNDCF